MMDSELRPRGTVERECSLCGWRSWHDPLSADATAAPYICENCHTNPTIGFRCTACNRWDEKTHRDLCAERIEHAHHCRECLASDVPYRTFAATSWCWSCGEPGGTADKQRLATQAKRMPRLPDAGPHEWQTLYLVCDEHAAEWLYDLPEAEMKNRLRQRGMIVEEFADGSWTTSWPKDGADRLAWKARNEARSS